MSKPSLPSKKTNNVAVGGGLITPFYPDFYRCVDRAADLCRLTLSARFYLTQHVNYTCRCCYSVEHDCTFHLLQVSSHHRYNFSSGRPPLLRIAQGNSALAFAHAHASVFVFVAFIFHSDLHQSRTIGFCMPPPFSAMDSLGLGTFFLKRIALQLLSSLSILSWVTL